MLNLKSLPIDISNVAILNPHTGKADRIGIRLVNDNGNIIRTRVFKSSGLVVGA